VARVAAVVVPPLGPSAALGDGVQPVVAVTRVAARTGIAFIAGTGSVVEIGAAGPLQEIAADRSGVAKLRRRSGQERFGDGRKAPGEGAIVSEIRIADECADPHPAVGEILDAVEVGKMADVDDAMRAADAPFIRSRRFVPAAR